MTMTTEASVSWGQALGWRLERHLLDPVGSGTAADVVRRLGAILAMDEGLAELAVRSRRASSKAGDLRSALDDGTVIKTFSFRGSTHYMAPEDAGAYLAIRASGRQWELPSWVEFYRLSPEDWPDFRAAVRDALAGGPLTVPELGEALASKKPYRYLKPVFDDGAGTLVKPLCWQGDVSLARRDGRHVLQRLDGNPHWTGIPDLDDAGPQAVAAYVRTYGPAPTDNLRYWLGSCLSAGRRLGSWVKALGDRLVAVDVEGTTAYVAREDVDDLAAARPSKAVRFLPGHDQWVMGGSTKDTHVTPPPLRDLMTRKANPVVAGGVVSGTWTRQGDRIEVDWLADGRRPATALAQEIERVAALR